MLQPVTSKETGHYPSHERVEYTLKLLINPTFLSSSSPVSVQFSREIKVGQDKGMLPALGDFVSCSFQLNCRIVSPSPFQEKEKIAIYRENKILSHGLYNWAYTLFTAQSLIQNKKIHSVGKTNRHHASSLSR